MSGSVFVTLFIVLLGVLGANAAPKYQAGTCLMWGDPHFTTFDGVKYDFYGRGWHKVLVTPTVEVRAHFYQCVPKYTCTDQIKIFTKEADGKVNNIHLSINNGKIGKYLGKTGNFNFYGQVLVNGVNQNNALVPLWNGKRMVLPSRPAGTWIKYSNRLSLMYRVTSNIYSVSIKADGATLQFSSHTLVIHPAKNMFSKTCGICGTFNQKQSDDFYKGNFATAKVSTANVIGFVNSWDTSANANPTFTCQKAPTRAPTKAPTKAPTRPPTKAPTKAPTKPPTKPPTKAPTKPPTTPPTRPPSTPPTVAPTATKPPTKPPTGVPTKPPTTPPTGAPTPTATRPPTKPPTVPPTKPPTVPPTEPPTEEPTEPPTEEPSLPPTEEPTEEPSVPPTEEPSEPPTEEPTEEPSEPPTEEPTDEPTEQPTDEPTPAPGDPTTEPTEVPEESSGEDWPTEAPEESSSSEEKPTETDDEDFDTDFASEEEETEPEPDVVIELNDQANATDFENLVEENNGTEVFTDALAACDAVGIDRTHELYKDCVFDVLLTEDTSAAVDALKVEYLACSIHTDEQACRNNTLLDCPFGCHARGSCIAGVCHCEGRWEGEFCEDRKPLLTAAETAGVITAGAVAGIAIGAAAFVGLSGYGAKKGYDYLKNSNNKMSNLNTNPLYQETNAGGTNPFYADKV